MSLFATTPIELPDANRPLKRVLGPIDLLLLGIGAIMGLSATIIVQMMAQPRIFFAMGNTHSKLRQNHSLR